MISGWFNGLIFLQIHMLGSVSGIQFGSHPDIILRTCVCPIAIMVEVEDGNRLEFFYETGILQFVLWGSHETYCATCSKWITWEESAHTCSLEHMNKLEWYWNIDKKQKLHWVQCKMHKIQKKVNNAQAQFMAWCEAEDPKASLVKFSCCKQLHEGIAVGSGAVAHVNAGKALQPWPASGSNQADSLSRALQLWPATGSNLVQASAASSAGSSGDRLPPVQGAVVCTHCQRLEETIQMLEGKVESLNQEFAMLKEAYLKEFDTKESTASTASWLRRVESEEGIVGSEEVDPWLQS